MIGGVRAFCSLCKSETDKIYVIGRKAYCPECIEKLKTGVENEISRVLIITDIYPPAHVCETSIGYAFVRKNDKWFFVIDGFYARTGSTTSEFDNFFELPDNFFVGMTLGKLSNALCEIVEKTGKYMPEPYYLESLIKNRAHDVNLIAELFR